MKKIILLEVRRQVAHLCFGTVLVFLLFRGWIDGWFLGAATFLFLAFILYWKSAHAVNCFSRKLLAFFEREEHIERFPGRGFFFFLLGSWLAVILFPQPIALAGILILAFGDSISHLYGRFLGKIKIPFFPQKNAEGHVFGAVIAALVSSIFVPVLPALIASIAAMLIEIPRWKFAGREIDDNLLIPLLAGGILFLWNIFDPFL